MSIIPARYPESEGLMKQVRLMVAILVLVTGSAWAQKYWNFDVDGNNEGWFAGNDISSLSTSADSLNVVYGSSDPFIYSPDFSGSPIPGNTYQWIQVDLEATTPGTFQIFFIRTDRGIGEADSFHFPVMAGRRVYHFHVPTWLTYDGRDPANWTGGNIRQFRFDFAAAGTLYVHDFLVTTRLVVSLSGSDSYDGSTWGTAKRTLKNAIAALPAGGIIWVRQGTYQDVVDTTVGALAPTNNIRIYGGFAGTETEIGQRYADANLTVINGASGLNGSAAYNVFRIAGNDVRLDCLTIRGGSARITGSDPNALGANSRGGGVYSDGHRVDLINCVITSNYAYVAGAGVCIQNSAHSQGLKANIIDCVFSSNGFTGDVALGTQHCGLGGGLNSLRSDTLVEGCVFAGNNARYGGGIYSVLSYRYASGNNFAERLFPTVQNSVFYNNTSMMNAAGIHIHNSDTRVLNCTFAKNTSQSSGAGAIGATNLNFLPYPGYAGGFAVPAGNAGQPVLYNNIITANAGGGQVLYPNIGWAVDWLGSYPGGTNYENAGNPGFFIDYANNNFHTTNNATVVDACSIPTPSSPHPGFTLVRDCDGTYRPMDGATGNKAGTSAGKIDRGAYEFDQTVPSGSVAINGGAAYTTSTGVTLNLTYGDGGNMTGVLGAMRFSNDNSTWTSWQIPATTAPWTLTSGDGTKTVWVQYRDSVGNTVTFSDTIVLDTTPPGVSMSSAAPDPTNTSPITVTVTFTESVNGFIVGDITAGNATIGGFSGSGASYSFTLTPSGQGLVTANIAAGVCTDTAGNPNTAAAQFSRTFDSVPPNAPVVTGTTPTNDNTPTWSWSSGGGGGNGTYRYQLDGTAGTWSTTTGFSYTQGTALADGSHTLYVQERDTAGNWSASGSFAITVDTAPPNAPIVTGTTPTNDTTPTWSWSSGGGGGNGTYRYQLDGTAGTWTTTTGLSYTQGTALADGSHVLYVQERDAAGNWSASGSFTILIDTVAPNAPVVTGITPTNDNTPTWNWSSGGGGGNGTYRYQLDGTAGTWTTTTGLSFTQGTALADGSHTLYVQERDAAGNWSASGSFAILIDTVPPNAPAVTGTTPTNDNTPTWSWSSGGGGGNGAYRYQLDGTAGTWTTTAGLSYTQGTALADGTHILYVQERDAAGNWSASGSFAILIDTVAPNAPVVSGTTPTNDNTPTWSWISGGSGGNGTYRYQLDGTAGTWTTTTALNYTQGTALADGPHTLYVQERDDAGNWSANGTRTITVDTTPPNPPAVSGSTPTNDTTPTWTWTSGGNGGNGTYQYQLDGTGGTWNTTTGLNYTPGSVLSDGSHTLYVQERDAVGNWSANGSFAILVDTSVPTGTISIEGGATYASDVNVTLNLTYNDTGSGMSGSQAGMRFSNDNSTWGGWQTPAAAAAWTLTSGDGTKTVWAQYRDAAGNVSTMTISDTIVLETLPPTGTISIANGAAYVTTTGVTLYLTYNDGGSGMSGGQAGMRFSNDNSSWGSWQAPAATAAWTLTTGDGTKTVWVQYRDTAGNESTAAIYDTILLDTTAPTGSIAIAGGAAYATTANVTLNLAYNDGGSGMSGGQAGMRFSNDNSSWSAWQTPAATAAWTLTSGDGTKTVWVQYRDAGGNTTSTVINDTILLDTLVPGGTIQIENGAAYAISTNVTLNLTYNDGGSGMSGGQAGMRFSNDNSTWGGWQSPSLTAAWTLPSGDGVKTVWAQYRDAAGLISTATISDTIELETSLPTGTISIDGGATYATSTSVTLTLTYNDAGSGMSGGQAGMRFSNDNSAWSGWQTPSGTAAWTLSAGDGTKTVWVQYRDTAGNVSGTAIFDTIYLDTTAPDVPNAPVDAGVWAKNPVLSFIWSPVTDNGGSGVASYTWEVSTDPAFGTVNGTGTTTGLNCSFSGSDGNTYYCRVQATDDLGHTSAFSDASDGITIDMTEPSGTIVINSDAIYTNTVNVTLTLSADDGAGSGVVLMQFSNDTVTWSGWEGYAVSKAWALNTGDGEKRVYAQFRDLAGNESLIVNDRIILDATPPDMVCADTTAQLDAGGSGSIQASDVDGGCTDSGSGIASSAISRSDFTCADFPVSSTILTVTDNAGNSAQCTATVYVASAFMWVFGPSPTAYVTYAGDNVTLSVTGCGGSGLADYAFTWWFDPGLGQPAIQLIDGVDHQRSAGTTVAITGATGQLTSTLQLGNLQTGAEGNYYAILRDAAIPPQEVQSAVVTVEARNAVTISTPSPVSGQRNADDTYDITAVAQGGYPQYTYQWEYSPDGVAPFTALNDGDLGGRASYEDGGSTLRIAGLALSDTGTYRVSVHDTQYPSRPECSDGPNGQGQLLVTEPLEVTDTLPASASIYSGEDIAFQVTASGGTTHLTGDYRYAWSHGGIPLSNTGPFSVVDTNTLQITSATLAERGSYACTVTDDSVAPVNNTVTSIPAALSIYDPLALVPDMPADTVENVGNGVSLEAGVENDVTGTPTGKPVLTYAWQYDMDPGPGENWVALTNGQGTHPAGGTEAIIAGTNEAELRITLLELEQAGYYRCVVTDGDGDSEVTRTARLSVTNFMNIVLPEGTYAYEGDAGLSITARLFGGIAPFTYEWFKGGVSLGAPVSSSLRTDVLDLDTAGFDDAGEYVVFVTDSSPPEPDPAHNPSMTSNIGTVYIASALSIVTPPSDQYAYAGSDATFDVTVTGGFAPYAYDWREDGESIGVFDHSALVLSPVRLTDDGKQYGAIVRDSGSGITDLRNPTAVATFPATLHVAPPIVFTVPPAVDTRVYVGEAPPAGNGDAPFALTAEAEGGFRTAAVQEWKRVPLEGPSAGIEELLTNAPFVSNTMSLNINPAAETANLYDYYVDITELGTTVTSPLAMVRFANHIAFAAPLEDRDLVEKQPLSFHVQVTGGLDPVTYQWWKAREDHTWELLIGEDTPTLEFTLLDVSDTGTYMIEVTEGQSSFGNSITIRDEVVLNVRRAIPAAGAAGLAMLGLLTAMSGVFFVKRRKRS